MIYILCRFHKILNEKYNKDDSGKDSITRKLNEVACNSPIWAIIVCISLVQICIFRVFVHRIDLLTTEQIKKDKIAYGYKDSYFEEQRCKIKNLWLINTLYLIFITYATLHEFIALYRSTERKDDGKCNIITDIPKIDSYFWLMSYLVNLIFW